MSEVIKNKLLEALKEMTAACAAAMRVLARHELADEFEQEFTAAGVSKTFGLRAKRVITEAERAKGAIDGKANTTD